VKRTLDFADHRRALGENRYVYPVVSRRSRGLSVGVNLNPDKVCNFDCPYCQVDRTTPGGPKEVDLELLEAELDSLLALAAQGDLWSVPPFDTTAPSLRRVNDVAFAGDGEPTTPRQFAPAVELAGRLLQKHGLPAVKPIVLTNATLWHRDRVMVGLDHVHALGGQVWAKLDAGTEGYFQFVAGSSTSFQRILDNLLLGARRWPIVIQAMFLRFLERGPSDAEVDAWLGRLAHIRDQGGAIELVQVYSVARVPARPSIDMLPAERLHEIAEGVRALGLTAEVYEGRPT
jgi:wyosine [tRNA(Phe)-imidazoG37] synthetase (radical SAM superfamily)